MENPRLLTREWIDGCAADEMPVYGTEITLLDLYAGLAMHAYVGRYSERSNVASYSYDLAEAMLKEREKRRKEREEG